MLAQAAQRGCPSRRYGLDLLPQGDGHITQLLKELDEQEAAAAAEQQEPDTQA